ncbi:copper-binding protein [Enterobacter hormaechei]|uniref:copper-binding protein n=1 Tax=Enterobacter hormaechei TaxID=158836 RepID=UPI00197F46CA|nr:copper-binding protein [Enterobacter hormaechei]MBN4833632.1 copper-binding protein [Enterobacter hormaechei]
MRTLFLSVLVGAAVSFTSYTVQANQTWQGHGVVQSIADNTVMLQHDAIPELKWPAMTMPFTLSAGATLNGAKPGDEVTITLERAGDGFQIVSLTPAR